MEQSHLKRRDPTFDSKIQAPTSKQAKQSNANLQETLLLSTNQKPSKVQEREPKDEGEMKNGRLIYSDLRRN